MATQSLSGFRVYYRTDPLLPWQLAGQVRCESQVFVCDSSATPELCDTDYSLEGYFCPGMDWVIGPDGQPLRNENGVIIESRVEFPVTRWLDLQAGQEVWFSVAAYSGQSESLLSNEVKLCWPEVWTIYGQGSWASNLENGSP